MKTSTGIASQTWRSLRNSAARYPFGKEARRPTLNDDSQYLLLHSVPPDIHASAKRHAGCKSYRQQSTKAGRFKHCCPCFEQEGTNRFHAHSSGRCFQHLDAVFERVRTLHQRRCFLTCSVKLARGCKNPQHYIMSRRTASFLAVSSGVELQY